MFCKDCGIDIRFQCLVMQGIRAWYVRPALFWISILPPSTFRDSHFTARWTEKGRFPTLQPLSKTKLSVHA